MTREKLEKIFEEIEPDWEGDNAFQGLQILSKYTKFLIHGAEHDIIYSEDVDEIVDKMSEEDAVNLRKLNWMIDDDVECFACFVWNE